MEKTSRIKQIPISFFSIILGIAGLTIAFQRAEQFLSFPFNLSNYLLILTSSVFILIVTLYLLKIIRFKDTVKNEFDHPIMLSFFPTFSISLLLLSIAFLPVYDYISKYICILGLIIHFLFTIKIISIWIQHTKFDINHMNPAWFFPVVGNLLIPLTWITNISPEIGWFFLSIGLFFWIILFVIFFNRIIFHHPLSDELLPTLFILISPPAIGFFSIVRLKGEINDFSKILYYLGLFITILLISQLNLFKKIKFYISWWIYSFPLSAITIATIVMFHKTNIETFKYLSFLLLSIIFILIILLTVKTIIAIVKKEILLEKEK